MKRIGTILIVAAVVAALLAVPLGVAAATSDNDDSQQATPGEQLGGVVGVQAAAVDGELDDRTFGQQIATADSDAARADRIDARLDEIEQRIAAHEDSIADLQERRDAGEISEGRYQAQIARLEAERANTERSIERANDTAQGLPADLLAERDINADRINELRTNARQLGGPATSEAAREIAGENVTAPIGGDRLGGNRGAGDDRLGAEQSTTDRDQRTVDRGDEETDNSERDASTDSDSSDTDRGDDENSSDADRGHDADSGPAGSNAN